MHVERALDTAQAKEVTACLGVFKGFTGVRIVSCMFWGFSFFIGFGLWFLGSWF